MFERNKLFNFIAIVFVIAGALSIAQADDGVDNQFEHSQSLVVAKKSGTFQQSKIQVSFSLESLGPACNPNDSYNCEPQDEVSSPAQRCQFHVLFPLVSSQGVHYTEDGFGPTDNLPRGQSITDSSDVSLCQDEITTWKATLPQDGLIHYTVETVDQRRYEWHYLKGLENKSDVECLVSDEYYEVLSLDGIGKVGRSVDSRGSVPQVVNDSYCAHLLK